MNNIILNVKNLVKTYTIDKRKFSVLNDVSFNLKSKEILCIMGQSGSGKTSLLNCLSFIDKPDRGSIEYLDQNILGLSNKNISEIRKKHIGFIYQDFNLIENLTAFENIAIILSINGYKYKDISKMIRSISEQLGILDILDKYPRHLSGGEKQRVAIARAMVNSPELILADEPTGALDTKATQMFMNLTIELNKKNSSSIIIVTHDPIVASYCDRVLYLQDGVILYELSKDNLERHEFLRMLLDRLEG